MTKPKSLWLGWPIEFPGVAKQYHLTVRYYGRDDDVDQFSVLAAVADKFNGLNPSKPAFKGLQFGHFSFEGNKKLLILHAIGPNETVQRVREVSKLDFLSLPEIYPEFKPHISIAMEGETDRNDTALLTMLDNISKGLTANLFIHPLTLYHGKESIRRLASSTAAFRISGAGDGKQFTLTPWGK